MTSRPTSSTVAIIGGGPAGLMAADVLSQHGVAVEVFDAMPSVGRKFLRAGVGGLNLTHAEAFPAFVARYAEASETLRPMLEAFGPEAVRAWAANLGVETFVGSSGRVFPLGMKAAPLLRAWLQRLKAQGVSFYPRHRWLGWEANGALHFTSPDGPISRQPAACLLALGGGSWARLGSDGQWVPLLQAQGIDIAPLQPANCGFSVDWSAHFCEHFAGSPLKTITARFTDAHGQPHERLGECVASRHGLEGSLIYALAKPLRETLQQRGEVTLYLDLMPGRDAERVTRELAHPRGSRSLASHLQSRLQLKGIKVGLLRECLPKAAFTDMAQLAAAIKHLPVKLVAPRPIDEAISTAGGVTFGALDEHLMLKARPGIFCAGEMLDWEAPTGGYLLTACFATGRHAAQGIYSYLQSNGS